MPRTEQELMSGWEFTLKEPEDNAFVQVDLPHDWAISAPINKDMEYGEQQGFRDRYGIGWYRRNLKITDKNDDCEYFLHFGGIYEDSTIWINGKIAGGHKYGYSTFQINITNLIQQGDNQILIKVDNSKKPADRWYSGAGIYRTVKLITVGKQHFTKNDIQVLSTVEGHHVDLQIRTGVDASVNAVLRYINTESETDHTQEITASSENGNLDMSIEDAALWTAEHPNLYTLDLFLMNHSQESDHVSIKLGFRKVEMIPNQGMFVNGEKVILKGVCLHQDAGCVGTAVKKEIFREHLMNLKDMGCNMIRPAHHLYAEEFLDLCDELGFYVYEECFDKWKSGLYGRYFDTEWKKDVEAMVKRDRNRPSIIIWGVGNEVENQGQDVSLDILRKLKEHVLTMDTTRPVSCAMNPHFKREKDVDLSKIKDIQKFVDEIDDREISDNDKRVDRIEKIGQIVDILGCNYQEQWYDMIHKRMPDKLILGTEVYQYFKGDPNEMKNFTEENPVLEPFEKDYVIGSAIWSGYDYLGEATGYPSKGWTGAPIHTNGVRKPTYYILQSFWKEEPMIHFSVMDYSLLDEGTMEHWSTPEYVDHWQFPQYHKIMIPYMIATNCDEVELYLNGNRYYVSRPSEFKNHTITGYLPYIPGTVEVVGRKNGKECCRHKTITPGPATKLVFDNGKQKMKAKQNHQMMLTVHAADLDDNPYFKESAMVRFWIEGPAKIIAVDNGSLMSNEPYQETQIHMFHGHASVMIASDGTPGRVVVHAMADGLFEAEQIIQTM